VALFKTSCCSGERVGTTCVLIEITFVHNFGPIQHSIYSTRGLAPDRPWMPSLDIPLRSVIS